jgi:hypothetical protein
VETKEAVDTYPDVPRPLTVEVIVSILVPPGPNAVENEEIATAIVFVVEINDEVRDKVETYPADPRPVTVETKFAVVTVPPPTVPKDVEKDEKDCPTKSIVETIEEVSDKVETYPADPRPMTVEAKV